MKGKNYINQNDYDKAVSIMVRCCLDFVIVNNGEVFLSKRLIEPYKGFWHLPGGMIRKGEKIKEAADRIIMSELGLKIESIEHIGYIESLDEQKTSKGAFTHSISLVFKTVFKKGELKGSFQAEEMKFFKSVPDNVIPVVGEFLNKNWDIIVSNKK